MMNPVDGPRSLLTAMWLGLALGAAFVPSHGLATEPAATAWRAVIPWTAPRAERSAALARISLKVAAVQAGLADQLGVRTVYLGGGSIMTILDHLYRGLPLEVRDLDVMAVVGRTVTPEMALELGHALEGGELGRLSVKDQRPRPRVNILLEPAKRQGYNAGQGFYWLDSRTGEILDLSLYHSMKDMLLNGILDLDCVMLRLDEGESLEQVAREDFTRSSYDALVANGRLLDRFEGYRSWLDRNPHVVKWPNVERDPCQIAIRVIRSFGKVGRRELPPRVTQRLKGLIESSAPTDAFQTIRGLLKILGDPLAVEQLRAYQAVGGIRRLSPGLDARLESLSDPALRRMVRAAPAGRTARSESLLVELMRELPASETRKLGPILHRIDAGLGSKLARFPNWGAVRD